MKKGLKRVVSLVLVLLMAVTLLPMTDLTVKADGLTYSYSNSSGVKTLTITGSGTVTAGDVEDYLWDLEDSLQMWELEAVVINGGSIVIDADAFAEAATSLSTATIGSGVTSIGEGAFYYCSSLTSVSITSSSLTTIGDNAFHGCGFSSISLPSSVTTIGESAFSSCSSLASVSFASSSSLTTIGNSAFAYDTCITAISLPDSVKTIQANAFSSCTKLASVTMNKVTTIGDSAFYNTAITSLTLPTTVTSVGKNAFARCTSLTKVVIPSSQSITLGESAFTSCSNLSDVTLGSKITAIPKSCFSYNYKLTSISIPSNVTSIGESAFQSAGLTSINIPSSVTAIAANTFQNCTSLTSATIPTSITSIGEYAFSECTALTSLSIPEGTTSIGQYAFYKDTSLANLTIPKTVSTIGKCAFANLPAMSTITVDSNNTNYKVVSNALVSYDEKTLVAGFAISTIPNTITTIGDYAFYECTNLTSLTVPDSVTKVGEYAFSNCSGLTSVEFKGATCTVSGNAFNKVGSKTKVPLKLAKNWTGGYPAGSSGGWKGGYFQWIPNISYVLNDGSWASGYTAPSYYNVGTGVTLPTSSDVSKENMDFMGWYTSSDFTGDAVSAISSSDSGDKTYYAKWRLSHEHNWVYSVSSDGKTLQAYCTNANGEACSYYETSKVTLTLSANKPVSGTAATITIGTSDEQTAWTAADLTIPTTISYEKADGTALESAPTTVGSYVAKVSPVGVVATDANTAKISFSIVKAEPTVTAPSAVSGLTYTGSALELVTAGSTSDGRIQYALSLDGSFSDSIPTAVSAGDYNVYYKVVGDSEHNDKVFDTPITVTIDKAAYAGAKTVSENVLAEYNSAGEISLPSIPANMTCGVATASTSDLYDLAVSDGKLTYKANATVTSGTDYIVTIPVTGLAGANYIDYDITVTLTGFTCTHTNMTYHKQVDATCSDTGMKEYWSCDVCNNKFDAASGGSIIVDDSTLELAIDPDNHVFGEWKSNNDATTEANGTKTRTCTLCGYQETVEDEGSQLTGSDINDSKSGSKLFENTSKNGSTAKIDYKYADTDLDEIDEATYTDNSLLLSSGFKVSAKGKKIKIRWKKLSDATNYDVYAAYCGKVYKLQVTTDGNKVTLRKINGKKINSKSKVKVYVTAYKMENGKKVVLGRSIMGYIANGRSSKYTNVKKVKISKTKKIKKAKTILKVGKKTKIKTKLVRSKKSKKLLSKKYANKRRYISSDTGVATVTKSGKIKAVGSGKCSVYVFAKNGYAKRIKVTVK